MSIVGGPTPQHFGYDSANRTVCLGSSAGSCSTRVVYDVNGKRVAEYWTGTSGYTVYVGDDFVWEDRLTVTMANVEVRLGGQRVALKRFQAARRGSTIVTSNRDIEEWVPLFDDPILANSALDRLAHNAHQVVLEGQSYRATQRPGQGGGRSRDSGVARNPAPGRRRRS